MQALAGSGAEVHPFNNRVEEETECATLACQIDLRIILRPLLDFKKIEKCAER
jgi:hypothetical protein